jgi:ABC-type Zn uptake system ZnuABC Zn-binding protein ZnuA
VKRLLVLGVALAAVLVACTRTPASGGRKVIAVESFLADIAARIAGDRLSVASLLPEGTDPHGYEPTPRDMAAVAECDLLIANGAGLEAFLGALLESAATGGEKRPHLIEASAGLEPRRSRSGEAAGDREDHEIDPHFWLDPVNVLRYVDNIRAAFAGLDPAGAASYERNAAAYADELRDLDHWIAGEIARIPEADRLLVTNHESLGYFADRYGLRVVGAIVASVSTGSTPGAREFATLVERIRGAGVKAVFLETGSDPRLAQQLAAETGVRVVEGLHTHSVTGPGSAASSYLGMMRANVRAIVDALAPAARETP